MFITKIKTFYSYLHQMCSFIHCPIRIYFTLFGLKVSYKCIYKACRDVNVIFHLQIYTIGNYCSALSKALHCSLLSSSVSVEQFQTNILRCISSWLFSGSFAATQWFNRSIAFLILVIAVFVWPCFHTGRSWLHVSFRHTFFWLAIVQRPSSVLLLSTNQSNDSLPV